MTVRRIRVAAVVLLICLPAWAGSALEPHGFDTPDMVLVTRAVAHETRPLRISVCGYSAFDLLGPRPAEDHLRALDFNLDGVRHDYPGHDLFVMVRKPEGRSGMDSVHWKYADIYARGSRSLLYHSDWGDWRLFEVFGPESLGFMREP